VGGIKQAYCQFETAYIGSPVGDLRSWERVDVAGTDVAEGDAATINQPQGVTHFAVAQQDLVEKDIGAVKQAEVLTDQDLSPASIYGAVELADIDTGNGRLGVTSFGHIVTVID